MTAALSGNPFVFLDNATGRLGSAVLNAYLSAEEWGARRLGVNDSVSVDRTTLVDMITGNNLLTTEDSERRVLPVFLDAQVARPGERSFGFNPKERVRANRKRYLKQYHSGMCISGVWKTTEMTPRRLASLLGPKRVATDSPVSDMYISPWL